ncbi:MAG TPA: nuclear transport factor 2 family protein [Bdellovibrionota bacterium]|jgi:hypothetical protein|nr:nuclear transport factor 2 family protein [Bdellovibrionota bacterium]
MSPQEMTAVVQDQLDAYNARDIDAFCACFHEEVEIYELYTGKLSGRGMAEFRARYQALFASSPLLHCELKSRIVLSSTVLDEEWVTGSQKYPNGIHAVAVYAFRDGKIDRVTFAS